MVEERAEALKVMEEAITAVWTLSTELLPGFPQVVDLSFLRLHTMQE